MDNVIDLKVDNYYELRLILPNGKTYKCIAQLRDVAVRGFGCEDDSIDAEFTILPSNIPQDKN